MTDHIIRAQVTVHLDGGLPETDVVNTFVFDADENNYATPEAVIPDLMTRLEAFYAVVDGFYPQQVAPTADVRLYNLRDAKPRAPIGTDTIALTLTDALDSLPTEVALCLSYEGERGSGIDMSHRRGRIYIGPLSAAFSVSTTSGPRVADANCQALADAGQDLRGVGTGLRWAIYSPTLHEGRPATAGGTNRPPKPAIEPHSIDDSVNDVVKTWVDDAFDTQRRRGRKALSKKIGV